MVPDRVHRVSYRAIGSILLALLALAPAAASATRPGGVSVSEALDDPRLPVNGEILAQELYYEQGYTVLRVWGSHYEMGYAHGYLMAEWLQLAYEQFSGTFGYYWEMARTRVAGWTFLPIECEEEFAGMIAGLRARFPETTMDVIDAKVASTIGDWLYAVACRSTCCWDDLVAPPYATLAMRKLQFMEFPPQITQQWHHVICAWEPDDGSPRWVNFGFGGYISAVTGVNEYGTLASLHDWNSNIGPDYPDALPRTMACRYVLTMALGSDPSTHLPTASDALRPYPAATGGFLNYYVPDGGAGVIKHSKSLGYYDTRIPRLEWMDGCVISTNNSDIDGTYGISPWAPYYNSLDPPQGVRATIDGLWETGYQSTDMHMLALGYGGAEEMAFRFEGRLQSGTTGRIELQWADLFRDPGDVEPPADEGDIALTTLPRAYPSPATRSLGAVRIQMPVRAAGGAHRAAAGVAICDPSGRCVRRLSVPADRTQATRPDDTLVFLWDGNDEAGRPVRPGIYLYGAIDGRISGRIAWLGP